MPTSMEVYFPFNAGAGADSYQDRWRLMMKRVLTSGALQGYLNELLVYADSTGMQCKVKTGGAWVEGFYGSNAAEKTLSIAAAHATLQRYDLVVVRLVFAGTSSDKLELDVLTGTPAGSPADPALTQNASGTWEIALARVVVDAAAVTIAANKVTDLRPFAHQAWDEFSFPFMIGDGINTITTGLKGYIPEWPVDADVIGWTVYGDASGSIVIDIWADDYANGVPTVADTIVVGSTKPTLSSAQLAQNTSISTWKRIKKGQGVGINVDSITTVKQVTVTLRCRRVK